MIDFTIKAETKEVADAAKLFLTTYKEQVVGFTNQVLGAQGALVDAGLKVEDDTIVIYQMNPDKGFVLGETTESSLALMDYKNLAEQLRYVTIEGDRIFLFLKEPQGTPDPKIGAFKTLNDAVVEFNSQSVKDALKNYADKKAAQAKTAKRDENRLARLNGKSTDAATDAVMTTSDEIGNS